MSSWDHLDNDYLVSDFFRVRVINTIHLMLLINFTIINPEDLCRYPFAFRYTSEEARKVSKRKLERTDTDNLFLWQICSLLTQS